MMRLALVAAAFALSAAGPAQAAPCPARAARPCASVRNPRLLNLDKPETTKPPVADLSSRADAPTFTGAYVGVSGGFALPSPTDGPR